MVKMISFFKEVRQELAKVAWPNFNEFIGSTIVVLIIIAAFAVYLGAIDFGLRLLSEFIYAQ
ncbi:TPA: preprotein translocase subunit SecE [Candidatus Dependentiae bacterium]|nr:MAG: SecE [candidate division TM6 bacterium GW2011_GWF2_36_131]KKQ19525.1 MAG: SecE [candidate division TM6 bacterium GW2011_GWA2_36_9]HBR70238.1 preprotein translocase subunit SecE [Candidatus Dependentiae bacterium]HCU00622.1 preprotein translocase subunit SecE [Candidatus Dependentiae bacterium]